MNAPCFRCTEHDRFLGCHSMCKEYIDFEMANKQRRDRKQEYYNKNGIIIESIKRHKSRNRNKNRTFKTSLK